MTGVVKPFALLAVLAAFATTEAPARAATNEGPTTPFVASGAATSANAVARAGHALDIVDDFGAKCDVTFVRDQPTSRVFVTATSGSATVSFTNTAFSSADVGKAIVVSGIGAGAMPLATTIAGVTSATRITLAAAAQTTTSSVAGVVAYGHDDSAAFASAIAALPKGGRLYLPSGACGVRSTIALPAIGYSVRGTSDGAISLVGQGRGNSVIVALASGMDAVAAESSGWHLGARLVDITLDARGVAAYAYDDAAGYSATAERSSFENGSSADVRIGDGTHQTQNAEFSDVDLVNDTVIFPGTPAMPAYGLLVNGTDSQFVNVTSNGASSANFRDTSWGNNFYTALHGYGPAQYVYWFAGDSTCTGCEVDGATVAGVRYDGGGNVWTGGRMFFNGQSTSGVYGFALYGTTGGNRILEPNIGSLTPNQYVSTQFGSQTPGNNVVEINGLSPTAVLRPNTLIATTTDAATATVLTLDGTAQTTANSIWLGAWSLVSVRGTLTVRDIGTGAGAAWDVSALLTEGNGAPTLVASTITLLQATSGFSLSVSPTVATTSSTIQSFALTVQGIASHTMHWTFTPSLAGAS